MRRIGVALSRLPVATVLLAGAAFLTGSAPGHAADPNDDVAMAVPRMSPFGDDRGVAWPRPLELSEAARIRRILALQRHGAMASAEREAQQVDTSTPIGDAMMGVILAQRYLGPYARPDVAALRDWLNRWPRLPDAAAIHALLLGRLPRGATPPSAPLVAALPGGDGPTMPISPPVPEETSPAERAVARNWDLDRSIREAARRGGALAVRRLLARTSGLTGSYASMLLGEAAQALFTTNQDEDAYELAIEGLQACGRWGGKSCEAAAIAGYAGGLAAWRLDETERARGMFETAWRSRLTTPSLRAGAAFWAARTYEIVGRDLMRVVWLRRAAAERDTFYGLLARRSLGEGGADGWDGPRETLAQADVDAVAATEEGARAFALLQVDEPVRAEAELRLLWGSIADRPDMIRAVMLIADHAGLSELAAQLADMLQSMDGRPRDQTRFRVPLLRPAGGFRMDPALVFAVARTESDWGHETSSSAGAVGIMQILPETASFITSGTGHGRRMSTARLRDMLADPATNMALGQKYLGYLANLEPIEGNLLHVLASYDCGPGRFAEWAGAVRSYGDPLLFIEAIPIDETRAYVPRVMTYTWLYAKRLRLPTPTLDALAIGEWPMLKPFPAAEPLPRLH